jgi:Lipase (class 3)
MSETITIDVHDPVVDVCTVGSPRAGKSEFRDQFDALIRECPRIVNQFDIVPHVPTLLTGWRHAGEEVEVDGNVANAHSLSTYVAGLMAIGGGVTFAAPAAGFSSLGLTARAADVRRLLSARIP